ncbi:nuclear speckle splicing regulatory protein 1 [Chaetomidium leptoderma]|uniref:Nuclear speckle splicing regulatory protein 1 n=1 Tax=Chaetomidium leptoderma TaxID=669021 RepID=A0AAN6VMB0_9PEZI|nr:nuclear speckle splicing regulatory protein 1 [Chaetomidium leptoderma]
MSKPVFSFGLKKAGPAKSMPALRKPAPFGGADDDGSGDETTPNNVAQVSELNIFSSTPSTTLPESRKKPTKKALKSTSHLPPPPLSKHHPSSSSSSTTTATTTKPTDQFTDLSSALTSRQHAASAEATDPSIYDYDAAYDSFKAAKDNNTQQEQETDGDNKKRPRYFDALLNAADVRERDRQIAEERRLQRERAAEGDEFADKEKFVTGAYRRQQEENQRMQEAEEKKEEAERKRNKGRGLAEFYKGMLERGEREHARLVKAAEEGVMKASSASASVGEQRGGGGDGEGEEEEEEKKSAAQRAKEINALGGNVLVNEDGEVVDKRQLLKGGLNVGAKKKVEVQQERERQATAAAARAGAGTQSKGVYATGGKQAMRERQTRMLESQLEESLKRSRQEEEAEAAKVEHATKSRKTTADISSAKERYLARKRAAEEAKKNGAEEAP